MTVTNPYYEFIPSFVPGTPVRSDAVNIQFNAIQAAFDFLPGGSSTAITTDTVIFAPESGSGNAYVVTMPDTRTSNQDGDGIRFFATHTNTGATTLNVDSIGAVALVNWDGTVLTGTEIVSGRIYEVRYDAVNTQFVLAATTDAALQVTFAEEWATKPEDVLISVAAGGDGATDFSALHWAAKSQAAAAGTIVNTDIVTATPPTTEAVTGNFEVWDLDTTDLLAQIGFTGSNVLNLKNYMHGGAVRIIAQDTAGTDRTILDADPDAATILRADTDLELQVAAGDLALRAVAGGTTSLYNNNVQRFIVQSTHVQVVGDITTATPPVAEAITAFVQFTDSDVTDEIGRIGFSGSNVFGMRNVMHGGGVLITAEDAAGTERTILTADPDTITILRGDTDLELQVAAGETALLATANARTALYYNNIEKLNSDLLGATIRADIVTATPPVAEAVTALLRFYDSDGSDVLGSIGYTASNVLRLSNTMHGGAIEIIGEDAAGTPRTILQADPDAVTIIRGDTNLELQTNAGDTALLATGGSDVGLFHNNIEVIRTLTAAAGGLQANNTATGAGFERVLTTSDSGAGVFMPLSGGTFTGNVTFQGAMTLTDGDQFAINSSTGITSFGQTDHGFQIGAPGSVNIMKFARNALQAVNPSQTAAVVIELNPLGGGVLLPNASAYQIDDAVGTPRDVISVDAGDDVLIGNTALDDVLITTQSGGHVGIEAGSLFRVKAATGGDYIQTAHDGTDANVTGFQTADLTFSGFTRHDFDGTIRMLERAAAAGDSATYGQIWVRDDDPSTLMYTDGEGADTVISGGVEQSDGSFTATLTGFTVNPTGTVFWSKVGNKVTLWITSDITGTSNSGVMTMTGLPTDIQTGVVKNSLTPVAGIRDDADSGSTVAVFGTSRFTGAAVIDFSVLDPNAGTGSAFVRAKSFAASGIKGLTTNWGFTYDMT